MVQTNLASFVDDPQGLSYSRAIPDTNKEFLMPAKLTPEARRRRAIANAGRPNPIIPVVIHTLKRGLVSANRGTVGELDRAFDQLMVKVPRRQRAAVLAQLGAIVSGFDGLSDRSRAKLVPREMSVLEETEPLDLRRLHPTIDHLIVPAATLGNAGGGLSKTGGGSPIKKVPGVTSESPVIDAVLPGGSGGIALGKPVKLLGENFFPMVAGNKFFNVKTRVRIVLSARVKPDPDTAPKIVMVRELQPTSVAADGQSLVFGLPKDAAAGLGGTVTAWFVMVHVKSDDSERGSNEVEFKLQGVGFKSSLLAGPVNIALSPGEQKPGSKVLVEADNLGASKILSPGTGQTKGAFVPTQFSWVEFASEDANEAPLKAKIEVTKASSATSPRGQGMVTVPIKAKPGGHFVRVISAPPAFAAFDNLGMSEVQPFQVTPLSYIVDFHQMQCIDESDPESTVFGNVEDEVFAEWLVIRVPDKAIFKRSSVYDFASDNSTRALLPAERIVFPIENVSGTVSSELIIQTTVYETDAGDVAPVQIALEIVGTLAATTAGVSLAFGAAKVAAIAAAVAAVAGAAAALVGLAGGTSTIGGNQLSWTATQLQVDTNNDASAFSGQIEVINSDDVGSYRLLYEVRRTE